MPTADINGVAIHFDIEGSGPPVLLIGGLAGNRRSWRPVVRLLREQFTVVTYDSRGVDGSEASTELCTIDALADDAAELIAHLEFVDAMIVGRSMGGSILQSLLIRHGDIVRRGIILNGFPSYTRTQDAWLDAVIVLRSADVNPVAEAVVLAPWLFSQSMVFDHAAVYASASIAAESSQPPLKAFLAQAAALRDYDATALLPTVTTPTLILAGGDDILAPPSQSERIAQLIPGARLVIIPGGHGMVFERTEETVAAMKEFLEEGVTNE